MLSRTLLLKMADSPLLRRLVESRGSVFAARFVAGSTLDDAIDTIRALNRRGIDVTLSHLGEHVHDPTAAWAEADIFCEALERIQKENVRCHLSVKPSQMALDVDKAVCESAIRKVVEKAAETCNRVRLDMEDSNTTDDILGITRRIHRNFPNIGVVIQAYLRRSPNDIDALNEEKISIRLCKGAYNEPATVAYPTKAEVDAQYVSLMKVLLRSGTLPAFATHDEKMIRAVVQAVEDPGEAGVAENWEFQMLYGIRRELQHTIADRGHRIRVYVPYGTEWFPYYMRRLAERPANVVFFLKSMLKR